MFQRFAFTPRRTHELKISRVKGIANIGRRGRVLLCSKIAQPVFVVSLGRPQRERPAVLVRNVVLWLELEDLVALPRRRCVMLQIIYIIVYVMYILERGREREYT